MWRMTDLRRVRVAGYSKNGIRKYACGESVAEQ